LVTDFYQVITNHFETNWFSTNDLVATVTNGNRLITNYVTITDLGGYFVVNCIGKRIC